MIKRILSVHAVAALLCLAGTNFAQAQCATAGCANGPGCEIAGGGCDTGHCGGGCLGGLLSKFHGGQCYELGVGGPCYTCENIWDGYCATKPRCLPQPHNPAHGKLFATGCGGCGGCNACAPGVGIYGRQLCPPKPHGHFLKTLFKRQVAFDTGCTTQCARPGCDAHACDADCAAAPIQYTPASPTPAVQEPPTFEDPVPPAPAVTDQTKNMKPHAFDWLQRALQLN